MENRFLDAMNFRHATKVFDETKKISSDDFNIILEAGRLSPSSFGFEPWKFIVLQNPELRQKMVDFCWGAKGQLPTASHFVLILARTKKDIIYSSEYISHMIRDVKRFPEDVEQMYLQTYENFQVNGLKILENERSAFDWASKQTYIAAANMMTAAAFQEIDSCPMEGFDPEKVQEFLANELSIPTDEFKISIMLAFGYRKGEPYPRSRQEMNDIVSWIE